MYNICLIIKTPIFNQKKIIIIKTHTITNPAFLKKQTNKPTQKKHKPSWAQLSCLAWWHPYEKPKQQPNKSTDQVHIWQLYAQDLMSELRKYFAFEYLITLYHQIFVSPKYPYFKSKPTLSVFKLPGYWGDGLVYQRCAKYIQSGSGTETSLIQPVYIPSLARSKAKTQLHLTSMCRPGTWNQTPNI